MNYSRLRKRSHDMIKVKGQGATLLVPIDGTYDSTLNCNVGIYGSLNDDVTVDAESIEIKSVSGGSFTEIGIIKIGDEEIYHTGVVTASGITTLSGLTRGHNGTTAEAHSEDDVVIALFQGCETYMIKTDYSWWDINREAIPVGDVKLLISPLVTLDPIAGAMVIANGTIWQIIKPGTVKPGETTVLWKCQARS